MWGERILVFSYSRLGGSFCWSEVVKVMETGTSSPRLPNPPIGYGDRIRRSMYGRHYVIHRGKETWMSK